MWADGRGPRVVKETEVSGERSLVGKEEGFRRRRKRRPRKSSRKVTQLQRGRISYYYYDCRWEDLVE